MGGAPDRSSQDHAEHRYRDYRLVNIFDDPDSPLRKRVIEFWESNGVLPRDEAERRSAEVVFVILDPRGEPAGVSTVYSDAFRATGLPYYFYRMFIAPAHRIHGMMEHMTAMTRDFLRARNSASAQRHGGVVVITENPKLMRPGIKRRFRHIGFQHAGRNPAGLDIWVSEF